jgi:hypothetical protein
MPLVPRTGDDRMAEEGHAGSCPLKAATLKNFILQFCLGFLPALIGFGFASVSGSEKKTEMSADNATASRSSRSTEALCFPLSKSLITVLST